MVVRIMIIIIIIITTSYNSNNLHATTRKSFIYFGQKHRSLSIPNQAKMNELLWFLDAR